MNGDAILDFWFGDTRGREARDVWFRKDAAFDAEIASRFGADIDAALREAGDIDGNPRDVLAAIVLRDQFTRNVFRDTPRAFAGDAEALRLARSMVDSGADRGLEPFERAFVYMPFEHSEDLATQERGVALFERLAAEAPALQEMSDYAKRHRDVVRRFHRFPHRNEILGRVSTAEEQAFLREPGSRF